jgi:hypothetical protein
VRLAELAVPVGEMKTVYTFMVRKHERSRPIWTCNLDKLEGVDQIQKAQDGVQWQVLVDMIFGFHEGRIVGR